MLVHNEYKISKLPKNNKIITPQIVILYINEISVCACLKYFLNKTKNGIPAIVIVTIVNKNKYRLFLSSYIRHNLNLI